jgi:hypothetical protein
MLVPGPPAAQRVKWAVAPGGSYVVASQIAVTEGSAIT